MDSKTINNCAEVVESVEQVVESVEQVVESVAVDVKKVSGLLTKLLACFKSSGPDKV